MKFGEEVVLKGLIVFIVGYRWKIYVIDKEIFVRNSRVVVVEFVRLLIIKEMMSFIKGDINFVGDGRSVELCSFFMVFLNKDGLIKEGFVREFGFGLLGFFLRGKFDNIVIFMRIDWIFFMKYLFVIFGLISRGGEDFREYYFIIIWDKISKNVCFVVYYLFCFMKLVRFL